MFLSTTFVTMNPVTLTLTFASLPEAQLALTAVGRALARAGVIDPTDRPDVGVSAGEKAAVLAPLPLPATTFNPFAPAEAAVAQVPPPPVAPSTAVAAAVPIAPVATPATSTAVPVPPVPAVPTVPAAPAPAAPAVLTNPAGIEVDRDGLPWDARIHASGRAKVADGTWRQKRGLKDTPELKAAVEAELRQAMGAPVVSVVVPTPPVAAPPTAPVPAAPAAPTTAVQAAPSETFATLMARVGPRLMSGAITEAQSLEVLTSIGLQSYTQLIQRPDLVPAAAVRYDALVAA